MNNTKYEIVKEDVYQVKCCKVSDLDCYHIPHDLENHFERENKTLIGKQADSIDGIVDILVENYPQKITNLNQWYELPYDIYCHFGMLKGGNVGISLVSFFEYDYTPVCYEIVKDWYNGKTKLHVITTIITLKKINVKKRKIKFKAFNFSLSG